MPVYVVIFTWVCGGKICAGYTYSEKKARKIEEIFKKHKITYRRIFTCAQLLLTTNIPLIYMYQLRKCLEEKDCELYTHIFEEQW